MPLPRFSRLPADEQRRILDAARAAFAAIGPDRATYADVIASTGISKSSAYNYFDGRDDLVDAVLDDVADRLRSALGTWDPQSDAASFWAQFAAITARLEQHLATQPDDLALIDPAFLLRVQAGFRDWIAAVIDNGIEIGVITVDCDRDLLVTATGALLRGIDAWWLDRTKSGSTPDPHQAWLLLGNLWGAEQPGAH
ncbi:MAG: TetR/AcrR family transcriptional regulator [Actinobacteria bacterium]|nr:TetR/AcrR family transcriptional regulator [Actinomycetota bacterium]MCB9429430.1 TetR/AcrR family transcriptional regulator [Actinomycetota bacterium]MCO5300744.1 TetR/AcrR family transcriptional regulator [Candidatus Nanopelagicales bacterium]HPE12729.1 TetR/AcrR family transcriptional regulator [Actinomycetota bacterium]HRV67273.1 TetR/AcrR family transcriptional regulator [Candidatus Nanopelagicales bacterium]